MSAKNLLAVVDFNKELGIEFKKKKNNWASWLRLRLQTTDPKILKEHENSIDVFAKIDVFAEITPEILEELKQRYSELYVLDIQGGRSLALRAISDQNPSFLKVLLIKKNFKKTLFIEKQLSGVQHSIGYTIVINRENIIIIETRYCAHSDLFDKINFYFTKKIIYKNEIGNIFKWCHQLKTGLKELHDRGLYHNDIKSENVILCDDDGELNVYYIDMDDVDYFEHGKTEMTLYIKGTRQFTPEIVVVLNGQTLTKNVWVFFKTYIDLVQTHILMCQLLEAFVYAHNKNEHQAWNLLSPEHTQDWLPCEHVLGTKITFIEQHFINSPFVHIVQNARELIRCQQEVYNIIIEEEQQSSIKEYMTKWETMLLPLESVQRGEQKEEVAAESGVVTEKRTIYKQFISF
jgi:serine/threonine protein kinase